MTEWRLAWRSALVRRRLFIWNVAVPLMLLTPVALSAAAAPHRVAVFGVFIVFFGAFGSAIPAVRDARDGWLDEVFRSGYAPSRWFLERTLAETAIDVLQITPSLFVLFATAGGLGRAGPAIVGVAAALLFANAIGPLIAAAVRSLAEAALAGSAIALLMLHFAGFFRSPAPGWSAFVARWSPYGPLRGGLETAVGGSRADLGDALAGLSLSLVVLAVLMATSSLWTRRLRWPRSG